MVDTASGAEAPPTINPTIIVLPPERQLSVQNAGIERQLSTHSGPSVKCFPVEYILENGYFTAPVVYPPTVSLSRKVAAELIGTFVLIFAATATPIVNEKTGGSVALLGNAATAGLAIMIVILSTGHISGAHVNPAITIAFACLRHFPWVQVGELAGIAVGACVTMNIMIAGSTSGASMNPVRTLGPAIAANNYTSIWLYILGPILGMIVGATAYTAVRLKREDSSTLPVRSPRR